MGEPPSSPTDLSCGRPQQQHSPRRPPTGPDGGTPSKKSSGGSSGGGKCKRVRTIFTADQLERLEAEFERQQYMVGPERLYLAHALNLTEAQVKVWFQNRRIKWRKQHLEIEQQRLAAIKQHPLHAHGLSGPPHAPLQPAHHHPEAEGSAEALAEQRQHAADDSGSEDSVLSEDRTYFASLVMPNGEVPVNAEESDDGETVRCSGPGPVVGRVTPPACSSEGPPNPDRSSPT